MKLEIILVTFYAVEPSKIKGKIVVRKTDRELQIIIARYAAICVVIVSWRSHRYAALLFLASDYISNNYFYVSERWGTLDL